MSKKKRNAVLGLNVNNDKNPLRDDSVSSIINPSVINPSAGDAMSSGRWKRTGKFERLAVIGIGLLLVSAVLGVTGLSKRISDSLTGNSTKQTAQNTSHSLTLSPVTTGTPQLSKEYIYAGSRLLAVEDAGANAAQPADLAVWRPSSGYWYVMGAGGALQASQQWGANGDITVPGDYDGDGKTDFCVFRPSDNSWYVVKSSDGSWYGVQFAATGDKPVPADYDGDGKTDIAVYRPSNGTWYAVKSSDPNNFLIQQFGLSTDKPAPADYDGDGKADIGVWRGSDLTFYSLKSSNGQLHPATLLQAAATDSPVSADYDGDGKADFAVKSGNSWIIKQTSDGQIQVVPWQLSGDKEVRNDYDGDGKVDIAVWRDTNGDWYIRQSSRIGQSNELRQEHWGQSGDVPVPSFYRR